MVIINFHIFDGLGNCLFSLNKEEKEDQTKLLYGFLYSLKSFTQRITPIINSRDTNFFTYSTNSYQLIFIEMATSMKFVLIVSPDITKSNDYYKQSLREFYKLYVDYVVKNPIHHQNQQINSILFKEKLTQFFAKV